MARKKSKKTKSEEGALQEETVMAEHNHSELESKIEALEAKVAALEELHESDTTDKVVELAVEAVSEVVEAKVKKAVANIKSGKVDLDFEEIFQWFAKRRKRGRPFRG